RLWDLKSAKLLRRFEGGRYGDARRVAFSPEGKVLASTGSTQTHVCLWDVATGRLLTPLDGHRGGVVALAVSPDSKRLASGGMDGDVLLWDLVAGRQLRRITNPAGVPFSGVAYAPDGKMVAGSSMFAGTGRKVWLWDA